MAKVTIEAGICGFTTVIESACDEDQQVTLSIKSGCPAVQIAAQKLVSIDAYTEIFAKAASSWSYGEFSSLLPHIACPVPMAILKAIEVAAGLALPAPVTMSIEK